MTNRYLSLKKSNKLGLQMLSEHNKEQIVQIVRYLKGVSWDCCGAELVCDALIHKALEAEKGGRDLFETEEEAKQFAQDQKDGLKRLRFWDYFFVIAPPFLFFGWGLEGLLLLWLAPQFDYALSLGYLVQFLLAVFSCCFLVRLTVKKIGFPPQKHKAAFIVCVALYIIVLFWTGSVFHAVWGEIVFVRVKNLYMVLTCLLMGVVCYIVRIANYEKDPRLLTKL